MIKANFSIIGNGYTVKIFDTDSEIYSKSLIYTERDLVTVLYNFDEFKKLNIETNTDSNSIFDIKPSNEFTIYELDNRTRLEILISNEARKKIFFKNIINENLLFPTYSFNYFANNNLPKGLILFEREIGVFAKASLQLNSFDINLFSFETFYSNKMNTQFISDVLYESEKISFKKKNASYTNTIIVRNL